MRLRVFGSGLALAACAAMACGVSLDAGPFGPQPGDDGGASGSDAGVTGSGDGGPEDSGGVGDDGGLTPAPDSGATDGAAGGDSGPPAVLVSFLALHASANLYDFRLCFGVGAPGGSASAIAPLPAYPDDPTKPMPETNYPGVPVGGGALLPAVLLAPGSSITPYVVRAKVLTKDVAGAANERTCADLICSGVTCLDPTRDYYALPAFSVSGAATTLLAVQGCE
ncbi:MAG TPA: hypothetical protein VIF09_02365, partial [Polyangiaceae bacterium]